MAETAANRILCALVEFSSVAVFITAILLWADALRVGSV